MHSLNSFARFASFASVFVAGALLAGCGASAKAPALGRTLAMQDDAGIIAVAWDTETARVYRDGQEVAAYEAESFDAALWSVDLPAYGAPRAPHQYDRLLTLSEIDALSQCDWSANTPLVECGLQAHCDCGTFETGALLSMFSLGGETH